MVSIIPPDSDPTVGSTLRLLPPKPMAVIQRKSVPERVLAPEPSPALDIEIAPQPEADIPQTEGGYVQNNRCHRVSPPPHWRYGHFRRSPLFDGGCWHEFKACMQASHWGYPEEFIERPFGACVCAGIKAQIENGMAAQMVLYRYDFESDAAGEGLKLNDRGHKQLVKIARMLQCNPCPLIIEATDENRELAAMRRDYVLAALRQLSCDIPDELVVVADSPVVGLDGEEALLIHGNMLRGTQTAAGTTYRQPESVSTGILGLSSGTNIDY